MLDERILPLNESPPIISYMHHAHPLSILATDGAYLPWFHSNYIQLISHYDELICGDPRGFNFLVHAAYPLLISPFLDIQWLDRYVINKMSPTVSDFLVNSIGKGYYVQCFVDEFYLPDRPHYQINHYAHEILVYGYNGVQKTCNVIGFNKQGKYACALMSFSEINQAFAAIEGNTQLIGNTKNHKYIQDKIWLGRYMPEADYDFDVQLVSDLLDDFLTAKNTSQRCRMVNVPTAWGAYRLEKKGVYGIDVYRVLLEYLASLSKDKSIYRYIPIHVLWEHKKCMTGRVAFMEEQHCLDKKFHFANACKEIERMAENLRLMMLKFAMTGDEKIISQMITRLEAMAKNEASLLAGVVNELN